MAASAAEFGAIREFLQDLQDKIIGRLAVEAGDTRALGRLDEADDLAASRGARELVEMGRRLRDHGVRLEVIGGADHEVRPLLRDAHQENALHWYGFVPNDRALRMAAGALAGISLLHDTDNYRHSLPTKVVEYMAHGLPVVTTPNPMAAALVTKRPEGPAGTVVPFGDPAAAARAVLDLRRDEGLRREYARTGHRIAQTSYHWPVQARLFVKQLEEWVAEANGPRPSIPRPRAPRQGGRRPARLRE